tara:strand:- start:10644 stop:11822 length:1179 start_codon:yes stop_codon:yes gene_type:complete
MTLPLEGIKIVSLGVSISGPVGLRHLADFGAEVIKIEVPEKGDMVRHWDNVVNGEGSVHFWVNPNKKSLTLNLKDIKGKEILNKLILDADIFLENFSPGSIDRLGYDYKNVKAMKKDIIYVHTSGYGQDGPYKSMKAFDGLIQAETGIIEMTGSKQEPAKMALSICDGVTGLFVALSCMMALKQRDIDGSGQEIDVSMFDCMVSMLGYFPFHFFQNDYIPERIGTGHHLLAPYGAYPAKNDKLIAIACASEVTWHNFARALDREEWISDSRFSSNSKRYNNLDALLEVFLPVLKTKDREEWRKTFLEFGVPCGCVNSLDEVCNHPQAISREIFKEVKGQYGNIKMCKFPVLFNNIEPLLEQPPLLGEHTDIILNKLGISEEEIQKYKEEGII